MARVQDFQTVTPSSANDNLLIVQAAGQGLAKIDAVGQKIATDTTISSLNTTSKKIAGAINEVNNNKASKAWTQIANLKVTANTTQNINIGIQGFSEFLFVFGVNTAQNTINYVCSYLVPAAIYDSYVSHSYYGDSTYRFSLAAQIRNVISTSFTLAIVEVSIGTPYQTNGLRFMLFAR